MGDACQVEGSCIQCHAGQQEPTADGQRDFEFSQWLVDFPQQSHHNFSSVEREDRKQIKNCEIYIQENGELEKSDKTQSDVSATRGDDSDNAGKMFRLAEEQGNSSTDLHGHPPDLFQRKINKGMNGATK